MKSMKVENWREFSGWMNLHLERDALLRRREAVAVSEPGWFEVESNAPPIEASRACWLSKKSRRMRLFMQICAFKACRREESLTSAAGPTGACFAELSWETLGGVGGAMEARRWFKIGSWFWVMSSVNWPRDKFIRPSWGLGEVT
jgi:hypothetical protein